MISIFIFCLICFHSTFGFAQQTTTTSGGRSHQTTTSGSRFHQPIFEEEHYEIKSCLSPELEEHERSSCRFYAMVVDAGSTGTRLHIFQFIHDPRRPALPFKLTSEIFEEVKPGLSSYESNPELAADSITGLLRKAKTIVPRHLWQHTPLTLKATAGLRLLDPEVAETILDAVENRFTTFPFILGDDPASILSGTDEGIFGWFTLNFLLKRIRAVLLSRQELVNTVPTAAALDLGGASTQVTFRPLTKRTFDEVPEGFIKNIRVFGKNVILYSHSYLGNGLMETRLGTLRLSTKAQDFDSLRLKSNCIPKNFQINWNYAGNIYTVRGTKRFGFESCERDVIRYIDNSNIDSPPELGRRDIYAFGYYFDRASNAGLLAPQVTSGTVRIVDFLTTAEEVCGRMQSEIEDPWLCLDLTYIYTLLTRGYGLRNTKQITLAKKIRGMETSWALGAAYHMLNTYHDRSIQPLNVTETPNR